jgi:hypothetical protein
MTTATQWRAKYDTMHRWHKRLTESESVAQHGVDDFEAFFIHCFHLKDWLKNDPEVDITIGTAAEALVNSSDALRICADLANGVKHLRLDRPRGDRTTRMEALGRVVDDPSSDSGIGFVDVVVIFSGQEKGLCWDASGVASACIAEWKDFLQRRGLLRATLDGRGNCRTSAEYCRDTDGFEDVLNLRLRI